MRKYCSYAVDNLQQLKMQMLNWANRFNICCFFDNHQYQSPYHQYECLLGVGSVTAFSPTNNLFSDLSDFYATTNDWIFGHLNYDLKNFIEEVYSNHHDPIGFPDIFLFVPEIVIQLNENTITIGAIGVDPETIYATIKIEKEFSPEPLTANINVKPSVSTEAYIETVKKLREHIRRGDCYEINYCQHFYADNAAIDPLSTYLHLSAVSPNPFSAYYRLNDKFLLCASPERYMHKNGNRIFSQPIKGTIQRDKTNVESDRTLKELLAQSEKDKAENVMVVDLVRNDLSKVCVEGTVQVDELFGIYSYPNVHQMISTVSGTLKEDADFAEVIKASFPMGSMTGAPKKRVMELIEQYEVVKRGIFSGTVGYISPDKNWDFNVVIRSIMYNHSSNFLSFQVGGGITYNSIPEKEYEECMLKATAIQTILSRQ